MENELFRQLVGRIKQYVYADEHSAGRYVKAKSVPIIWDCLLADYFDYNVTKGGFAQLLYNLKGEYVEDIEQLLLKMNAKTAHNYFTQAVDLCLENIDEYRNFIGSEYASENILKNELHSISFKYFKEKIDIENEVTEFIERNHFQIISEIKNLERDSSQ